MRDGVGKISLTPTPIPAKFADSYRLRLRLRSLGSGDHLGVRTSRSRDLTLVSVGGCNPLTMGEALEIPLGVEIRVGGYISYSINMSLEVTARV